MDVFSVLFHVLTIFSSLYFSNKIFVVSFSSPNIKGHVRFCHHLASVMVSRHPLAVDRRRRKIKEILSIETAVPNASERYLNVI